MVIGMCLVVVVCVRIIVFISCVLLLYGNVLITCLLFVLYDVYYRVYVTFVSFIVFVAWPAGCPRPSEIMFISCSVVLHYIILYYIILYYIILYYIILYEFIL